MPDTAVTPFRKSKRNYERWLKAQLDELWEDDLDQKHRKMRESPFVFLRATYWRWAETILTICPDLKTATIVPGVGDIHLENYGVWRDIEGRLAWGVNDFDEAADMPYAVDLVRLAASAALASDARRSEREDICAGVLRGYREGLQHPRPFILDEQNEWLRLQFVVSEDERADFWKKMRKLTSDGSITRKYRQPIERQLPGADAVVEKFARRAAGTGSLGRPRWVGVAEWRGGTSVREAKAVVASGWTLAHRSGTRSSAATIAAGRYRAVDPWYVALRDVVVRRLSPNARKIEVKEQPKVLFNTRMHRLMGRELANVHLGTSDLKRAIEKDLAKRGERWLERAERTAADFINDDFEAYRR
jgi:uncharacterized protein (DUF2252 family)